MKHQDMAHERLLADAEQHYLNLVHRFVAGQINRLSFQQHLHICWADQREILWRAAQKPSDQDFRPLARLLDRLMLTLTSVNDEDLLRSQIRNLLKIYRAAKSGDLTSLLAVAPRLPLFEQPLPPGWVYPCSVDDIGQSLARVLEQDMEGLWAVGLGPPERQNRRCYGTYLYSHWQKSTPVIFLHARPAFLSFKMCWHYSIGEIEQRFAVELSYGMTVEWQRCRPLCRWNAECLRRFAAEHVLLHEVGHHVQRRQRQRAGLPSFPGDTACEQFAEDYALQAVRERTID